MSEPTPLKSREHYTAAYDNVAAVPDVQVLVEGFRERSRLVYAHQACERNIAYGPGSRQVYDWFAAGAGWQSGETAPVFVFIHGGYWQWRTKEDFACVATGPLSAGMHVILAEYTLAPQARMPAIVAEIGTLLESLQHHPVLGLRTGQAPRLVLAGHSAGGHLAAMHRRHPTVAGVLAISGIFELDPIARGALNDALQLSDADVVACSPQRHIARGAPTCIAVGGAELPELQRQSSDYAAALRAAGGPVDFRVLPARNHFDILAELESPEGSLLRQAVDLCSREAMGLNVPCPFSTKLVTD